MLLDLPLDTIRREHIIKTCYYLSQVRLLQLHLRMVSGKFVVLLHLQFLISNLHFEVPALSGGIEIKQDHPANQGENRGSRADHIPDSQVRINGPVMQTKGENIIEDHHND